MQPESNPVATIWSLTPESLKQRPLETGFAIDSAKTKVVDDAFGVNEVNDRYSEIKIHIADAGMIGNSPTIMNRAWHESHNNSSRILPDYILDKKLNLGVNRYGLGALAVTISFIWDNQKSEPHDINTYKSRLHTRRYSYETFTEALKSGNEARLLGATALRLDKKGLVGSYQKPEHIVASFMRMGNYLIANEMHEYNVPWLYRSFNQFSATAPGGKHLPPKIGRYTTNPKVHQGYSLPFYSHFSSPLRRIADLFNHQNHHAWLTGQPIPYGISDLNQIAANITSHDRKQTAKRSLAAA